MDEVTVDFHQSAFNHDVSKEDIIHALKHRIDDMLIGELPDKWAVIGPNRAGNPLEIMYNVVDNNNISIFHAMNARESFIKKFGL